MFKTYRTFGNCKLLKNDPAYGTVGEYIEVIPQAVYGEGETVNESLTKAIKAMNLPDDAMGNLHSMNRSEFLTYQRWENSNHEPPSEEEVKKWKKREFDIFWAYYTFWIVEERTLLGEEAKQLL